MRLVYGGAYKLNGLSSIMGSICLAMIDIIIIAMFIRAIMSLFIEEDNVILSFLYSITEPIILPVRKLFDRFNFMSGLPIDLSFLITYVLLSALKSILEVWF